MSQSKARIGFIGAGWWATSNHMPAFSKRDDVEQKNLVVALKAADQDF